MLLRLIPYVLFASTPQRGAPHLLRFSQRQRTGGIELERLGALDPGKQVDDVVERARHVDLDFGLGEIPATLLLDEMKDALPRFGVRDVNHAPENPPIRRSAEDRRTQNAVEMPIRV